MSNDPVARAEYCREYGNFDDLHDDLVAEVKRHRATISEMLAENNRLDAEVERLRGALDECVTFWLERYNEGAPHEYGDYNTALWDCICNIKDMLRGDQ